MKLFDRFDKVFCLNLKKRTDRLKVFTEQVERLNLGSFEVFEAIDGYSLKDKYIGLNKGEVGHILTTIKILEKSIENNLETILLVEDDCHFKENIKSIDSYFEKVPSDWDMLYFGGNHQLNFKNTLPTIVNENVLKLQNTFTSHCVAIKKHMFEFILVELKKINKQTDVVYRDIQKNFNVYCFHPSVATQQSGFSDIQNHYVNYNYLIS